MRGRGARGRCTRKQTAKKGVAPGGATLLLPPSDLGPSVGGEMFLQPPGDVRHVVPVIPVLRAALRLYRDFLASDDDVVEAFPQREGKTDVIVPAVVPVLRMHVDAEVVANLGVDDLKRHRLGGAFTHELEAIRHRKVGLACASPVDVSC